MTQEEYLQEFKKLCEKELELTQRKNADYADIDNAFANFELIHFLSCGRITPEEGFVVRMSDKLQRIVNLISRPNQVPDEKLEDTLFDLGIYCKLFQCYLKYKNIEEDECLCPDHAYVIEQVLDNEIDDTYPHLDNNKYPDINVEEEIIQTTNTNPINKLKKLLGRG